jgi:methylenetetrahydrofolate dehydrogenase (NADP+)/methenyltetrahydrofolate cyclohydrolase
MGAELLDGKALSLVIKQNIKSRIEALKRTNQRIPGLAVILVGQDPASSVYVQKKMADCAAVGLHSRVIRLDATCTQAELNDQIEQLNQDTSIDGILVQLPLPPTLDAQQVINHIDPNKDVDGFHPYNVGCLVLRQPRLRPCTPKGIMRLLNHTSQSLRGLHACIVGASNIVGRPMAMELLIAGCTVTVAHRFTKDLQSLVSAADLVIVAVGKPKLIPGNWIKPGAIVVDVGITRLADGQLVGDVEFEIAKQRASWITPVPGGVGPMTVACLLENTLEAYELNKAGT